MTTPCYTAQITIPRDTGLAKDNIVNVLHFEGDDGTTGTDQEHWDSLASGLGSRIRTFYETLAGYMPSTVAPVGSVKLYNMRDPEPRIPRHEDPIDLSTASAAVPLPAEVALCLSMKAAATPGVNMARRRGRIYLGPFATTGMFDTVVAADSRPSGAVITLLLAAAATMARGTSGSARLAVYSPKTDLLGSLEDALNDVSTLWIDNAWDTQRRRGGAPTSRQVSELD